MLVDGDRVEIRLTQQDLPDRDHKLKSVLWQKSHFSEQMRPCPYGGGQGVSEREKGTKLEIVLSG